MLDFRGGVAAVLVTLAVLGGAIPVHGQSLGSALLEGTVESVTGDPIARANLSVRDLTSGVERSVRASLDGRFAFEFLPPGEYSLRVEQLGFRPRYIYGIPLNPGQRLVLPVSLTTVEGPAEQIDSLRFEGAFLAGRGSGLSVVVPRARFESQPYERRELTELARYSSLSGPELEMQGLPAALSGIRIDGATVSVLESAALLPGSFRTAAFPLGMFDQAALVLTNPDVEWSGVAGGTLSGYTGRGSGDLGIRGFGAWSGGGLLSGVDPSPDGYQSMQGGFTVGGALIPDTATMMVGVEARRIAAPFQPLLGASTEQAVRIARETYGLGIGDDPEIAQADVLSAFGRFDWQLSSTTGLSVRASFATLPEADGGLRATPGRGLARPFEGQDLSTSATLSTRFSDRVHQEIRIGFDATSRDYDPLDAFGLPGGTRILGAGVELGPSLGFAGSYGQNAIRASETLHIRAGDHRLKVGLSAALESYDYDLAARSRFLFPGLDDFTVGRGYLEQLGPSGQTDFSLSQAALYAQDTWTPVRGLDVLLGARVDLEQLPTDDARLDESWLEATGIDNTAVDRTWWRISPRIGFTWDLQDRHEWVFSGSAGMYSGSSDPALLRDWVASSRERLVRREFGVFDQWPLAGTPGATAGTARTLTLLHPEFAPPRTFRSNLGISRSIGPGTAVHLSALFRYTDLLPRGRDLNLFPNPALRDQFGRTLYGELEQAGGLLFATPESNRRFSNFDRVVAIDLDGSSTHSALTVEVEHEAAQMLELFGSYTFSRTDDNWSPEPGVTLVSAPVPDPVAGADWMEGRSDFDVPHRIVAGAEMTLPGVAGLRLAGLYRYRSGHPFTPGFREGVDANADGSWTNDPAFIDSSIPGTDALLNRWECLRSQVGGFAERNSCRTDGIHSLEARLAFGVARGSGFTAELFVDGLNLLASSVDFPDRALYLVDPSREVIRAGAAGPVTVPLVVNENFGNPIGRWQPGRVLRVGFRLNH